MSNNIWKLFPRGQWYLVHPIRFIKELLRPFKWAWQRSCRGYADCDCWEMGFFLIKTIPSMLDELAKNPRGYPYGKFENTSEWAKYLNEIAMHFRNADEDKYIGNAHYSSSVLEHRQKELDHALDMLKPVFFNLWD